eukprot:TRINITY_DN5775_c0_g1_i1.p1 TRINITY_DN5775_c0_g1~~TRINITY_DN5775_c0_g1_i1.p1  ORF type:complete len:286 (-),score=48.02 TRINITY_DN5775_c0_g1_i1:34-891(-)
MNEEQKQFYKEKGYVIIEDLLTDKEIQTIKEEMLKICSGERGSIRGLVPTEKNEDVWKHYLAIHFPHKISQTVLELLKSHEKTNQVLSKLIGPNVKACQSMMFLKPPGRPGQAWHQDEYYIPSRDRSLTAVWIAIDDATVENGGLWVIPGSHKSGILWPMKPHNDENYDASNIAYGFPYDDKDAIPVELKAGSAVFFNGYLLHKSLKNKTTDKYRRAFANHYLSAESLLPWNWDGRIKGHVEDNRDIVMVTGDDPYAHKGLEDNFYPFIRADTKQEGAVFNEVVK